MQNCKRTQKFRVERKKKSKCVQIFIVPKGTFGEKKFAAKVFYTWSRKIISRTIVIFVEILNQEAE